MMKRTHSAHSTRTSNVPTGSTHRGTIGLQRPGFRDKSLILDEALREYLRLRDEGQPVDLNEFCKRYPDYRWSLRRLIDVEESLPPLDSPEDDPWPDVGHLFLGYEILELLGAGSIARVFLASDVKLGGRMVAIKVSPHGGYEAETLGKLRHENIVEVYSVSLDEQSDLTAVCMPYQGNATLADVLDAAYGPTKANDRGDLYIHVARHLALVDVLPPEELSDDRPDRVLRKGSFIDATVHIGVQLASALKYAHEHGVLHRDLKPSNVLLTPAGKPMLLDFNMSYDAAQNVVHHGGTLPYAAPEQLHEANLDEVPTQSSVDARADVFGLGVILYELLTGQLPFGSPPGSIGPRQAIQCQIQALKRPIAHIRSLNPRVDSLLAAVIEKCLEVDPAARFQDMVQLEKALRQYFQPKQQARRWVERRKLLAASLAIATLGTITAVSVYALTLPPYHERQQRAGIAAIQRDEYEQAIRHFDQVVLHRPENGYAIFLRGVCYQRLNDHARALAEFERAKDLHDTAELFDHRGYSFLKVNQPLQAAASYGRVVKHAPNESLNYVKHAYAQFKFRSTLTVVQQLNKAIELDPKGFQAYFLRAYVRLRASGSNSDITPCIQDIQAACKYAPPLAAVEFEAARILSQACEKHPELGAQARNHLEAAVRLGCPRGMLENQPTFEFWKHEIWFSESLSRCFADRNSFEPTLDDFLCPSPTLNLGL